MTLTPARTLTPASLPGAREAPIPTELTPQLASPSRQIPEGDSWLHEIKLDGYRIMARKDGQQVALITRSGLDWTARFPQLHQAIRQLPAQQLVSDGEVVSLRPDGVSDFGALQAALSTDPSNLIYFLFDLTYIDGIDLTNCRLVDRKRMLREVLAASPARLQYCDHVVGSGKAFFEQCRRAGLEGIVSKRADARYRSGRNDSWLKSKCLSRDEFVIGGFARSGARRAEFSALLLGYFNDQDKLIYVGKVGTGFSESTLRDVQQILHELEQSCCPFETRPEKNSGEQFFWVQPVRVAQIEYLGWSNGNMLRHPAFQGLRDDLDASQVSNPEAAVPTPVINVRPSPKTELDISHLSVDMLEQLAEVTLSNPAKTIFPADGITKLELAKYYVAVSQYMLPHIAGRPLALVRYPNGIEQESFFQKHPASGMPVGLQTIKGDRGTVDSDALLTLCTLPGLAGLAHISAVEIHTWASRSDRLDAPDRMVFDLDPDGSVPWTDICYAAKHCREVLTNVGLESFVKLSGGKGLHVVVPLARRSTWNDVERFAQSIATVMCEQRQGCYTTNTSKRAREGKILIDVNRNARGATCVAAYSVRARIGAPVSMPVEWQELTSIAQPDSYRLAEVVERLRKNQKDPWAAMLKIRQSLTKSTWNLLATFMQAGRVYLTADNTDNILED